MPEWQNKSCKRVHRGDSFPRDVHAKVAPRYVGEPHDACMSREYKVLWACYKAYGTDLQTVASGARKRTLVRNLNTKPAVKLPEGINDVKDS